jgi:hypothetical protein
MMNAMWLTSTAVGRFLLVVLVTVTAGSTLGQTFQPGGAWIVRDANNKTIGEYVGANVVSTLVNGQPVGLLVTRLKMTGNLTLWFDQPGCHGNAFVDLVGAQNNLDTPAAFAPDGTIRIAPYGPHSPIQAQSFWSESGSSACHDLAFSIDGLPATEVGPNVRQQFQPPFSVVSVAQAPTLPPAALVALLCALAAVGISRLRLT